MYKAYIHCQEHTKECEALFISDTEGLIWSRRCVDIDEATDSLMNKAIEYGHYLTPKDFIDASLESVFTIPVRNKIKENDDEKAC